MPPGGINPHPLGDDGHLEDVVMDRVAIGVALEHL